MTIRSLALSLAALLALVGSSASFTSHATARPYNQGGVIPGSADDFHFDQRRGWVRNQHRPVRTEQAPRRHGNVGNQRGHNRAATANRSRGTTVTATAFRNVTVRKTGSFRVLTGQTVQQCVRSRITGEIRC